MDKKFNLSGTLKKMNPGDVVVQPISVIKPSVASSICTKLKKDYPHRKWVVESRHTGVVKITCES